MLPRRFFSGSFLPAGFTVLSHHSPASQSNHRNFSMTGYFAPELDFKSPCIHVGPYGFYPPLLEYLAMIFEFE
jgi:hypothetical protein